MKASKKPNQKQKLLRVAVIVFIVLAALTLAVLLLRSSVTRQFSSRANDNVQSAQASVGSISATVSGSGYLADEDIEDVALYSSVIIEELHVSAGDKISEGDLLASVDLPSVLAAMNELQDQLNALDSEINAASSDTVGSYISSSVTGRVKRIFVQSGDAVQDAMYENGALAVLSLDHYMAVDIPAGELSAGDAVSVDTASGHTYAAAVDSVSGDTAVVLVTDNGPVYGESVTVYSGDALELGSGELYIHKPLSVTGYGGTVSSVLVQENDMVYSGSVLMYLKDTSYTAQYDSLLKERNETEELLAALVRVYKEGALYARSAGSISAVSELDSEGRALSSDGSSSTGDTQVLMSVCPDKTMTVSISIDESDILSLSVGQEATVTVDSIEDESFSGSVTRIERTGTASNGVTYYTAEVTLDKTEQMLSGMSASVAVRIEGVDGALIIPSDALHQTSSSSYVYTSYNAETGEMGGMKEVTAGLNNGSYVEISSGLEEGDTVYYTESEDDRFFFTGGMDGGMPGGRPNDGMPGGMGGGMPSGGRG